MEFDELEPWRKNLKEVFDARKDIEITKFSVEKLGKHRDYVKRLIVDGTANPSPSLLQKICDELGVSVAKVLTGEDVSEERDRAVRRVLDADASLVRRINRAIDLLEEDQ